MKSIIQKAYMNYLLIYVVVYPSHVIGSHEHSNISVKYVIFIIIVL